MSTPTGPYAALQIPDFLFLFPTRFWRYTGHPNPSRIVAGKYTRSTKRSAVAWVDRFGRSDSFHQRFVYAGHLADIMNRKKVIVICLATLLAMLVVAALFHLGAG